MIKGEIAMTMAMTPDDYFEGFVKGNYEDYIDNQGCVRRAFNAAISASQMANHWLEYYKRHDPSKVSQFSTIGDLVSHISNNTNGYFADIRSIANAYKHLYTGAHSRYSQYSSIASTGAIEVAHLTGGNIQKVNEKASKVVYTRKSGQQLDFLPALQAVFQYWDQDLLSSFLKMTS
jgi:hypothetical protein